MGSFSPYIAGVCLFYQRIILFVVCSPRRGEGRSEAPERGGLYMIDARVLGREPKPEALYSFEWVGNHSKQSPQLAINPQGGLGGQRVYGLRKPLRV